MSNPANQVLTQNLPSPNHLPQELLPHDLLLQNILLPHPHLLLLPVQPEQPTPPQSSPESSPPSSNRPPLHPAIFEHLAKQSWCNSRARHRIHQVRLALF